MAHKTGFTPPRCVALKCPCQARKVSVLHFSLKYMYQKLKGEKKGGCGCLCPSVNYVIISVLIGETPESARTS